MPELTRTTLLGGLLLAAGSRAGNAASPDIRELVVVFKTHFDIGYTDFASNIVQRYRTTFMDQALEVVDRSRALPPEQQFVWTIPGWPAVKMLEDWPGQTAERQRRIRRAFAEGRFVVHALPFTLHTELLEPEELVRGLGYASRLSRGLSLALPRDAKMTDVPCHSWILPTLLRHAGVDFLHLGCNAASHSPEVPLLFWWEGPDGSRLLTMYSAAGYGTGVTPPPDWPYHTWLALMLTGDNHGPPRPEEVRKILAEARAKLPHARVRIGRLSDFADALLAEQPDLPVVRGDMPDTWIHGPMSDPAGARLARNTRPDLTITELLHTELRAWRVDTPDMRDTLAAAWEQSLLYGEHTWGGAYWWIYGKYVQYYGAAWQRERAAGRFDRIEASWEEHSRYIRKARALVEPLLRRDLRRLARAVDLTGPRVVVFNPLPWPRSGYVEWPRPGTTEHAVAPNASLVYVPDLPAGGYRTWTVPPEPPSTAARADATARTLESPFFKVTLDPARGAIASIVDRRTGRELVDPHAPHGFGSYLYERFDADQVQAFVRAYVKINANWATNELGKPTLPPASEAPYRAVSPRNGRVTYATPPGRAVATWHADASDMLPHAVTTRVTVYADAPWLDLEITLHDKPADSWPEGGWLCLPFNLRAPRFRLGRLGGIVDPARDVVRGANRHLFGLHTGVALFDSSGAGVGVCPLDNPLVSLGEPGLWKYSLDYVPTRAAVYVNLFNNQWTTNFRLWNEGTWTARVRLWAFTRYDPAEALIRPALEARYPLQAASADGPAGRLPAMRPGLTVSRPGVMATALTANPDGPGFVLRLWEMAGRGGPCTVTLPEGFAVKQAQPLDLRGRLQGAPLPVEHRRFTVTLPANTPASFRLDPTWTRAE